MLCFPSHLGFEPGSQAQHLGSRLLRPWASQVVLRIPVLRVACSFFLAHPFPSLPGKFLQMSPPGSLLNLLGDPPFHCALLEPPSPGNQASFALCPGSWGSGPFPPPTLGLPGAGASCAVLPPRLQCLHFHLWSDGHGEDLQYGGGKGRPGVAPGARGWDVSLMWHPTPSPGPT